MKTKDFIKKLQSIGYGVGTVPGNEEKLCVVGNNENIVLSVHTKDTYCLNTDWNEFRRLDDEYKEELLDIAFDYIKTPVEEREEPKKYYLKLPRMFDGELAYMNYHKYYNEYFFNDRFTTELVQTQFTQEEIDNLPNQDFIRSLIKEEVE